MGLLDGVLDTAMRRTKDNLTYKAGDVATSAVTGGAGKMLGKLKGEKDVAKRLDKCPKCKAKLEADAKFCPECGQRLVTNCEKCTLEYPLGTKFCKQCGGPLK